MSAGRTPVSWTEAEPGLVEREQTAMAAGAPDMYWCDDLIWRHGRRAVGWRGLAPVWGGEREKPAGVDELLAGRRLELRVIYLEAYPAVPPVLDPIIPEVPIERRTLNAWHVNGDGTLCMMQAASDWDPSAAAAELVTKASGWFIEYLLADAGNIERMTQQGVLLDTSLDETLAAYAA